MFSIHNFQPLQIDFQWTIAVLVWSAWWHIDTRRPRTSFADVLPIYRKTLMFNVWKENRNICIVYSIPKAIATCPRRCNLLSLRVCEHSNRSPDFEPHQEEPYIAIYTTTPPIGKQRWIWIYLEEEFIRFVTSSTHSTIHICLSLIEMPTHNCSLCELRRQPVDASNAEFCTVYVSKYRSLVCTGKIASAVEDHWSDQWSVEENRSLFEYICFNLPPRLTSVLSVDISIVGCGFDEVQCVHKVYFNFLGKTKDRTKPFQT